MLEISRIFQNIRDGILKLLQNVFTFNISIIKFK